jgi:hypothetical protein
MLKKIALALLVIGLSGCGPLGLPSLSASSSSQSTTPQPLNDFAAMRCSSAEGLNGC